MMGLTEPDIQAKLDALQAGANIAVYGLTPCVLLWERVVRLLWSSRSDYQTRQPALPPKEPKTLVAVGSEVSLSDWEDVIEAYQVTLVLIPCEYMHKLKKERF